MIVPREAVSVALFNTLVNGTKSVGWQTTARKGLIYSDLSQAQQPAMFLFQTGERSEVNTVRGLYRWTMQFWCLIYLRADAGEQADGTTVETQINQIIDAIENAINPNPGFPQQLGLGDKIENAWLEGQIVVDTGIIDQQCAVVIPINVRTGSPSL